MATIQTLKPVQQNVGFNNNEYYNIRVYKPLDVKTSISSPVAPVSFNATRTSPVLNRPSDYSVAVVRFYLPSELPIFVFDPKPGGIGEFLQMGMSYDGYTKITDLVYDPYCADCLPTNSVLYYQEFIDMINTALKTTFDDLKAPANKPLAPPTQAPYFTYDSVTKLCSLYAQNTYDSELPNPVKIYMNATMFSRFFPSLIPKSIDIVGDQNYFWLRVQDNKNNNPTFDTSIPAGYLQMKQEYTTLALWNDVQSILLETDHIPVNSEFEGTENDITRRILTDFEPVTEINNRQAFQYQPSGALRWYDLKSEYPLSSIDLKVFWQSKAGVVYPLILLQGGVATLKLRFKHKYTGETFDEDM